MKQRAKAWAKMDNGNIHIECRAVPDDIADRELKDVQPIAAGEFAQLGWFSCTLSAPRQINRGQIETIVREIADQKGFEVVDVCHQ